MNRTVRRRSVIAATGGAVASAGCVGRLRNIAGRDTSDQLTLEINTVPADDDPNAARITRQLSEHLNAVGVDARINTMAKADLRRSVLLNHDFDVFVGQFYETAPFDPDMLYGLTHSSFAVETGWQNPFGFTELAVDELLEAQRFVRDGNRREIVADLQEAICDQQPFTVVAFPDALTAIRDGRFVGWEVSQPTSAQGLLQLDVVDGTDDEPPTLRLVTTDERITENLNPIAAEYRRDGTFTWLLYDPLLRPHDDEMIPWLARDWHWTDPETIRVTLRDASWHDGQPITATDVAFTYSFLRDTSMGKAETPIPTPKYRGRSSVVKDVRIINESTADISVGEVNPAVGERAMELPILPEHVWSDLTDTVAIAGIEIDSEATEALVWNNEEPIGSGPLRFDESTAEESVTFERHPDHFLRRLRPDETDQEATNFDESENTGTERNDASTSEDSETGEEDGDDGSPESNGDGRIEGIPAAYIGGPAFDRLEVLVSPSDIAAVQTVGDGDADATVSNLGQDAVPRIGREADARLVSTRSAAFYHIGYNTRRAPLSNPRFRTIIASLIDKQTLVDDAFGGYAIPATSPLAATPDWVPDRLAFDTDRGTDPVTPFRDAGDGSLDVESVRTAFREAGYRFNDAGELLSRDQ